jgi:hypothetical protein
VILLQWDHLVTVKHLLIRWPSQSLVWGLSLIRHLLKKVSFHLIQLPTLLILNQQRPKPHSLELEHLLEVQLMMSVKQSLFQLQELMILRVKHSQINRDHISDRSLLSMILPSTYIQFLGLVHITQHLKSLNKRHQSSQWEPKYNRWRIQHQLCLVLVTTLTMDKSWNSQPHLLASEQVNVPILQEAKEIRYLVQVHTNYLQKLRIRQNSRWKDLLSLSMFDVKLFYCYV